MIEPTDISDPCALAEKLRVALANLISGQQVAVVEFESGAGTKRRTEFHKGDVKALREELAKAEAACRARSGGQKPARVVRFITSKGV
jgi:hypothetical protein